MTNEEIFIEAGLKQLSGGGSITNTCQCGRFHFAGDADNNYDENEFKDLMEKYRAEPKKYIWDYDSDSVSIVDFNGAQFVRGCPCGWERKYATFIWEERAVIVEFLKMKRKEVLKEAIKVDETIGSLEQI